MAAKWRDVPGNDAAFEGLGEAIARGKAIAFVGAGASAGLYPLWSDLIRLLAEAAVKQGLATSDDRAYWLDASTKPQQASRGIKQALGSGAYAELLRKLFAPRRGADGNFFTPVHRCLLQLVFRGIVTTNYDPGLLEARRLVRPPVAGSGFATWKDQDAVNRWLTRVAFDETTCPILFAHGYYERSDTVVLGTDEYRDAYRSDQPFTQLMRALWGQEQLVFAGFGFSDPWLDFIAEAAIGETAACTTGAPRHFAIIGLSRSYTPQLRRSLRDAYNADPIFYPVRVAADGSEDHAALLEVLQALVARSATSVPDPTPRVHRPGLGSPSRERLFEYRKAHISKYSALIEGRHLVKIKAVGRSGSPVDASIELVSWASSLRSTRLAVLGDAGSGKTFLLRQLCSTLSERAQCTPVFINAGQLRNLLPSSREELLAFADPPVPHPAVLDATNIIVIIDGLDELIGPTSNEQVKYFDTLDAVGRLIPQDTRLIVSCRSTTFEATNRAVSEAFAARGQIGQLSDPTDVAIRQALAVKGNPTLEHLELTELTKEQARKYLSETVGEDGAENQAAAYVLEHLPRVPVILRFLQLALPELRCSTGSIDLDELYSAALRASILRDPAFADQNVDIIWKELRTAPPGWSLRASDGVANVSDPSCVFRLVHSGLLSRTPSGEHVWSHFSIMEFLFANWFEEIKAYNANTLASLNLIGSYNIIDLSFPCAVENLRPWIMMRWFVR